jgi:hypothetical protein
MDEAETLKKPQFIYLYCHFQGRLQEGTYDVIDAQF